MASLDGGAVLRMVTMVLTWLWMALFLFASDALPISRLPANEGIDSCFVEWQGKNSQYKAKRNGPAILAIGKKILKLQTVNLAAEKERTLTFIAKEPGRLLVRNTGESSFEATLSRLSQSKEILSSIKLSFSTSGKEVAIPIAKGKYRLSLEEGGEYEEPSCPPLTYDMDVALVPIEPTQRRLLEQTWADKVTVIKATPQSTVYQTTLAALHPESFFIIPLAKPALVEIQLHASQTLSDAALLVDGLPRAKHFRALVNSSKFTFSLQRLENIALARVDLVIFSVKTVSLDSDRILQPLLEKSEVETIDRVSAKLVFKNTSHLSFQKITLIFEPFFSAANVPPSMQLLPALSEKRKQRWAITFGDWKNDEERRIDFGVLIPNINQIQTYDLSYTIKDLVVNAGPLEVMSEHFLIGNVLLTNATIKSDLRKKLAVKQMNMVEHPDYESQLKIPVMANCAKKFPEYGEPFQKCQNKVFRWRNRCSESLLVTSSDFVNCVREGIFSEAPELLAKP